MCYTSKVFARISFGGLLVAFAFLVGCAGLLSKVDDNAALRKRATLYWNYRVSKDFAQCYLLESPEVRSGIRLTDYVMAMSGGIIWIAARVDSVSIDGDVGVADVEMRYAMMGIYTPKGGVPKRIKDYWRRVDGEWFHVYKQLVQE